MRKIQQNLHFICVGFLKIFKCLLLHYFFEKNPSFCNYCQFGAVLKLAIKSREMAKRRQLQWTFSIDEETESMLKI